MQNFSQYLERGEKILYQGYPKPGEGAKKIRGNLFFILMMGVIQIPLILELLNQWKDKKEIVAISSILIFLVITLFLDAMSIYNIIYTLLLKKRAVSADAYCLTNKRVFKYDGKKRELVYGYLINYKDIKVNNLKNHFGDVYMAIMPDKENIQVSELNISIKDIIRNYKQNMPSITFESVQDPEYVADMVRNARQELLDKVK